MPPLITRRNIRERAVSLTALVVVFLLLTGINLLQPPQPEATDKVIVEIPPATTAAGVGQLLKEKGLIKSSLIFRLLGKLTGQEKMIKAGQYLFSPGQKPHAILQTLAEGQTVETEVKVTIPEGYTVRQMARLLAERGVTAEEDFIAVAKDANLRSRHFTDPVPKEVEFKWEGLFFPDTYSFLPNTPAEQIGQRMLERMEEIWDKESQGLGALPANLSPRDIITMASLVEREAKVDAERPIVAAVFYNRLQQNMPLQSCATVQYLLPEPKPVLSTQDTRIPSPYNTYLHAGLPPGPIAAPGQAAIKAALRPADSKALYFVAKPDGSHAFSNTLGEHIDNQRKYQSK